MNSVIPPRPVLPRARCSVSASHRLLPAPGGSAGARSPSSSLDPGPEPRSRLHRTREEAAPVLHPLSLGPGEMPAKPSCSPRRRMARAGCECSCRGSLWADGNRESFISPHCWGEGVGRGRPRKFSFCHHRTKIRMSTTSKMMKRTTIAHHCRRSGKKRKRQSSCFSGEGKLREHFSSCTARNQIQAQAIKSLNKFLWEKGCGAGYCSEAFSSRTHWGLGTAVGILRLLPNQVQTALKSWLKSNWEEQAESCCVCCSFME